MENNVSNLLTGINITIVIFHNFYNNNLYFDLFFLKEKNFNLEQNPNFLHYVFTKHKCQVKWGEERRN